MSRIDDQKSPLGIQPKSKTGPTGPAPLEPRQPLQPALAQDATAIRNRDRVHGVGLSDLVNQVRAAQAGQAPAQPPAAPRSEAEPAAAPKPEKKGFFASLWGSVTQTASSAWSGVRDFASDLWGKVSGKASEVGTELYHKGGNLAMGVTFEDFKTREVVDDPSDVNNYTYSDEQAAVRETRANAKAEEAALAKLSPEDQARYKTILGTIEGEDMARRQMQAMLLSGALTDKKALVGSGTLLGELHHIVGQPLASGIDRKDLLAQVIGEVENPVRIAQQSQNTCGATTAQILLARKNPAEYVRLIAGLAAPAGKIETVGGATIKRKEDWNYEQDGGRSVPSRLFQPAIMQLGQMLPGFKYDNSDDSNVLIDRPLFAGMFGVQQAKIDSELLGVDYDNHMFLRWNRDSQWEAFKKELAGTPDPIPVSMTWDGGGHFVQVDKIEGGKVHYTNPWGQRETMDEAEFKAHITEYQSVDD